MTSTSASPVITEQPGPGTFDSLDPATGEVVGTYPVHDAEAVDAAVARARAAAGFWSPLPFAERGRRLITWAAVLTRRMGQLAELVHAETGKPHSDAQLEIVMAIEHITWAARHAAKVLGPRRAPVGLLMLNHAASVEYQPLGVVGVIGPWNYPVFTPVGSIAYALAAGNAVVFKPSEYTPGTGAWLVDTFAQVVPEAAGAAAGHRPRRDRRGTVPGRRGQDRLHRLGGHRQEGDARLRRRAGPGRHRGRRQGRAARRRRRRHPRRRRRGGLGRHVQRRAVLRRGRAGLRPRTGLRRVPRRGHHPGPGPAGRPRAEDRPDDDPGPARRGPRAHRRRAGPRRHRPGRRPGRGRASVTCSRRCCSTCPRTARR